jgi:hypothetical protein
VPVLLYRGTERLRIGEVWCLPVEEFLRDLRPDLPFPVGGKALGRKGVTGKA